MLLWDSAECFAAGRSLGGGWLSRILLRSDAVRTAAAIEGLEGRVEGDVGHMEVATNLKF